ncbi:undecaprenyldiphospho-muramoylpentapeptide beta-N-acetylglucosaminyltransferase [Fontisphaera persica]|uniref:undecaprenyldiphospho-muramoylpentapeptide beta-N-acetylglucosaminyltransferase n=1 Tax=Fontisphaera persica TaxID=2974023 RepID=UPI0024BFA4FE|nr:undecaprenyldiphospho-muramoylpentapeptide beta-N-acetylglucosaminyltransferase [Fontisphaera persica]WCJ58010.1 undecaprenyldiphospho-muramoylpentapeptide beta-N-acetylglucosaminyltransferase [Fontisphaera persica]
MMTDKHTPSPLVAIACGGTGGHLFPGLAVAEELQARRCDVWLLISPKEVDQKAVQGVRGMEIKVLPAVGLSGHRYLAFLRGFWQSYQRSVAWFKARPPHAVLAMGGFTSAPPIHAGRRFGAVTFLHESNTIPGRANRWLARFVHQPFVGFPSTAARLKHPRVVHTGTPVRPQFQPMDPGAARRALGLRPHLPTLLIMGGSQGAGPINELVLRDLDALQKTLSGWQFIHFTGDRDEERVRQAYAARGLPALVRAFFSEMELALGAATLAVSRAGASSLAEFAAMRLPAILIPYPAAADNHQYFNARALADAGAAVLLEQAAATPERLVGELARLAGDAAARQRMAEAVARWHHPEAAARMAEHIVGLLHLWKGAPHAAHDHRPQPKTSNVLA